MKTVNRYKKINDFFDNQYAWWEDVYDNRLPRGFFSFEMIRRKEILLELLEEMIDRKTSVHILECGCGPGGILEDISSIGNHLTGVDINISYLAKAKSVLGNRANLFMADVEQLPFRSKSFDIVYCVGVLSYLEQDRKAIEEICRVTKPGGKIIISLPNLFTLNKIVDPYYYFIGLMVIIWRKFKRKLLRRATSEPAFQKSMIRRYRFGQLDDLYRELGLLKGQTHSVSFGPPTLWRKEILTFYQATRISDCLTKISKKNGFGFLRYFSNHWITCLEKPATCEGS